MRFERMVLMARGWRRRWGSGTGIDGIAFPS
jgi:hypothetical protein